MRFVEAVALVEHKISTLAVHFQIAPRLLNRVFYVGNARLHGVELYKIAVGSLGYDICERSFARAGRSPENTAAEPV